MGKTEDLPSIVLKLCEYVLICQRTMKWGRENYRTYAVGCCFKRLCLLISCFGENLIYMDLLVHFSLCFSICRFADCRDGELI